MKRDSVKLTATEKSYMSGLRLATDYEPHRWSYALRDFPPMDPIREALAYAEIRAHEPVVSKRRDKDEWFAANRLDRVPERFCEHCGVKLERRLRGAGQRLETVARFMARRFCSERHYQAARRAAA